ncbi:MAG: hypothetical protein JWM93_270 [Frankiales bacterium]|nr:hypothetical protein [Frankiales bacterium]
MATCWQLGGTGTSTATLGYSSTAHSGVRSAALNVTSFSSGNRKVVIDQRTSGCAPKAVPGHKYTVSAWYQSSTQTQLAVYYRDSAGSWHWWAQSALSPARNTWGKLSLLTPTMPSGATAISFGPSILAAGWLLVDDAAIIDETAATPTTSPTPTTTTSASPIPSPTPTTTTTSASPTPSPTPTSATPSPTTTSASPSPTPTTSGTVVRVSTASQLSSALSAATAGETILLADGTYSGHFTLSRSGTSAANIRITGTRNARLDGGSASSGYVLHLDKANYVRVDGITVTNGQKAIVLDESSNDVLDNLDVYHTGDEAVLLRNFSRYNVVSNSAVHDSGVTEPGYGEGVYIGLSQSNWNSSGQSRTGGAPDTSDYNQVIGNQIYNTGAENVDIKEGTTGGLIANNHFDSTGMSGQNYADSWVDAQGNNYTIRGNVGVNPGGKLLDGFQTHVILSGWGKNNLFTGNSAAVNAPGYGFNIQTSGTGNIVKADNTVTGAGKGFSNIAVTP